MIKSNDPAGVVETLAFNEATSSSCGFEVRDCRYVPVRRYRAYVYEALD